MGGEGVWVQLELFPCGGGGETGPGGTGIVLQPPERPERPFRRRRRRRRTVFPALSGDCWGFSLGNGALCQQPVGFGGPFGGGGGDNIESRPVFFLLRPRAGVSSAVLEVHVGTRAVFSVEGQEAVLPAWYTSRSQKKPYVTWLLDKEDGGPFQVSGGGGEGGGQAGRWPWWEGSWWWPQ